MTIEGYNTHGARTYGAEFARNHPDELPDDLDQSTLGQVQRVSKGVFVTIGKEYRLERGIIRVLMVKEDTAMIVDTRRQGADWLEEHLFEGRLIQWRGVYWRVKDVMGTAVVMVRHGTKVQAGWVRTRRGKYDMVIPAGRN